MTMLPTRRSGRTLTAFDPSREFEDIYRRMGQLASAAFGGLSTAPAADMPWSPPADLTETDDAYQVHLDVPGAHKEQLNVLAGEREIQVTGEIAEPDGGRRHRSSRLTGQFDYQAVLPGDIKADQVTAELADGVLTITAPKSEEAKPSHVAVTG
jgi:HSP20 family protein